ncbi:hypothetical protein SeMB42_g03072 [Synchytrium endobioticum]|uniref:Uncharacterized protein n=1 Tax=Synchytrium endobioticum TaxID=286115 RepID=A0A507DBL8_9FUNG|nr:hypothetical protein SeMB42_g03072 [Synchytrium endobioticum]
MTTPCTPRNCDDQHPRALAKAPVAPISSPSATSPDMLRTDEPTVPIGEILSSLQSGGVSAIPPHVQHRLHRLAQIKPHISISESQLLLLVSHDAELDFEKDHPDDLGPQDHHLQQHQDHDHDHDHNHDLHKDIRNTSIPNKLSDDGLWSVHSSPSKACSSVPQPDHSAPYTSNASISSSPSLTNETTPARHMHRRHTPDLTRSIRSKTTTPGSNGSLRKFTMRSPAWPDPVDDDMTAESPFIQSTTDNDLNIMTDGIDPVTKRLYHAERALAKAHADADERASEWRADITAVTGELDAKKREAADLKVAEHALQSQVEALEAVIEKLNLQVSGLQTQIGQHVASIKAHEEKLGHCAETENGLREMLEWKENEMSRERSFVDALEREKAETLAELAETKSTIGALQQTVLRLEIDLENGQKLNANLTDRIAELEAIIREGDVDVSQPMSTRNLSNELAPILLPPATRDAVTCSTQTEGVADQELQDQLSRQNAELTQVREALHVLESQKAALKDQIQVVDAAVMDNKRKLDLGKHYDAELKESMQLSRNDVRGIESGLEGFRQAAIQEAIAKLETERLQYLSMMQPVSSPAANVSMTGSPPGNFIPTTRETMVQTDQDPMLPNDFEKCWPPSNGVVGGLLTSASLQDGSLPCIAADSANFSVHRNHKPSTTTIISITTAKSAVNWIVILFVAWFAGVLTALMLHTAPGYSAGVYGDGVSWTLAHFIRWLDIQLAGTEARVLPT